ncbi:hypothetical protein C8R42DRAFT_442782 [Lentinula raphanica]|nr:hypothetical protein C8R42DRAFT_442782 [Lentinula raphanica]
MARALERVRKNHWRRGWWWLSGERNKIFTRFCPKKVLRSSVPMYNYHIVFISSSYPVKTPSSMPGF